MCAIRGTASPPLPYTNTGTARAKKAPLISVMPQDVRRSADQGPFPSHTASHLAQAGWRSAEDMGNHDQGQPGTDLRTASLRPRTMEKGLGEWAFNLIRIPNLRVITLYFTSRYGISGVHR